MNNTDIDYLSGINKASVGNINDYVFVQSGIVEYDSYAVNLKDNNLLVISTVKNNALFKQY